MSASEVALIKPTPTTPKLSETVSKPNPLDRWIVRAILIGLIIAFTAVVIMIYWALVPIDVLEIKNNPLPVRPTVIDGGAYVIATFDYCKYMDIEGEIRAFLVSNKTRLVLPISVDRQPKGCKMFDAPIPIPPQTTTDTYSFHYQVTYNVNPLRQIVEEFDTKKFTVIRVGEASPSGEIIIQPN